MGNSVIWSGAVEMLLLRLSLSHGMILAAEEALLLRHWGTSLHTKLDVVGLEVEVGVY